MQTVARVVPLAHAFDSKKAADRERVIAEVIDLFAKSSRAGIGK
ncbi:MAG: hypothetical protein ACI89X_003738 [Planctomycetota bacterium]|jgi:hypothetical protein